MLSTLEFWRDSPAGSGGSIWDRICRHKSPVVEPRESSKLQETMEEYYSLLKDRSRNGAVFFAVCRGKVSEGLDFANENGRAVVVTGLPYPPVADPKVKLKRLVLDETHTGLSGSEWYAQQAMRAVNQAVGRVIRHRKDYGAIILCDERFAQPNTVAQLSLWLRPAVVAYNNYGEAIMELTKFFKSIPSHLQAGAASRVILEPSTAAGNQSSRAAYQAKWSEPLPDGDTAATRSGLLKREREWSNAEQPAKRQTPAPAAAPNIMSLFQNVSTTRSGAVASTDQPTSTIDRAGSLGAPESTLSQRLLAGALGSQSQTSTGAAAPSATATQSTDRPTSAARSYMQNLKEALPAETYKALQLALREFRDKRLTMAKLCAQVVGLLSGPNSHFLEGFKAFLPPEQRSLFQATMEKARHQS
eukprot:TRINITY_DN3311_c0_g1_i2.p1 TRINITY_DN3311_c0_g1~~TRINITY_DN3311_c0_g1_i2.p1  ORF type:complete len:416 (-),score=70.62 TRINITY_DN3311_c0_g1_i2:39-1286(-)